MNDALGHPITAGCTVLTSNYWSPTMNKLMKVKRVTKTKVVFDMDKHLYGYDNETKKFQWKSRHEEIRRWPHQVIVIDKQLRYNKRTYPEHLV